VRGKEEERKEEKKCKVDESYFAFLASNDFHNAYAASPRKSRGGNMSKLTVCTRAQYWATNEWDE